MKKYTYEKVDENIYFEKLDNGLEVYLYPTNKTKNFYITISVKYGAKVLNYKLNDKKFDVIPGSAHFLEHKVMALSENEEISKRINNLGSLANAWTSYHGTNYNIYGSINIRENLKLLLDIFYNTNINEKCVEEEKGIIGEEIDMYKDQINSLMYDHLFDNLFHNSYVNHSVTGERTDIERITAKSLNRIYDDYYTSSNTFIVVCGSFDKNEILNDIKEYMNKLNLKKKEVPKRIKLKEKETVKVAYEEIQKDTSNVRVKYAIKIPKKNFNIKNDNLLRYYLNLILGINLSATSKLFEKYKSENIIYDMGYGNSIIDDYVVIIISSTCSDADIFIKNIEKDIEKLVVTKEEFERKKKLILKAYVTDFENIEDIEYNISNSLMMDNKIDFNEYSKIDNMNYEEACNIINAITYDNVSIIKTIK